MPPVMVMFWLPPVVLTAMPKSVLMLRRLGSERATLTWPLPVPWTPAKLMLKSAVPPVT